MLTENFFFKDRVHKRINYLIFPFPFQFLNAPTVSKVPKKKTIVTSLGQWPSKSYITE
jgi:hypothetical protein